MKKPSISTIVSIICTILSFSAVGAESRLFSSGQLSSNLITSAIQDNHGYIWIGTEYGLNRYDGIRITEYYKSADRNSLLDNSIRDLYCDKEGRIWIGMITGMQMYDHMNDSFHTVRFEGTSYTPNVSHITQLSDGRIWIIVSRLGIFEVDAGTMTARPVGFITELCGTDHFNNIHEDIHQRIWVGTDDDGIFCLDNSHDNITSHRLTDLDSEEIDKIGENINGIIVAACDGRIWMFDEVRKEFISLEQPEDIYLKTNDFLLRSNGDFLIATSNHGLWKIDEPTHSIVKESVTFPSEISLGNAELVSLMEDAEDNLWCGCIQRGIVMVPPRTTAEGKTFDFMNLSTIENLGYRKDYGAMSALSRDSEGNTWCGTQDGTLFVLDRNEDVIRKYNLKNAASCIFEDRNRDIWIGMTDFGLSLLDRKTGRLKPVKEMEHISVSTIIGDGKDMLYIGTQRHGIWEYDIRTKDCRKLEAADPGNYKLLRNSYINRLMIDSRNRLWVGHFLGAACFDIDTRMFLETAVDPVLNSSVGYALTETDDGRIWIGTNNGIFVWNDTEWNYRRYTVEDGLSSDMICGLETGAEGEVWCSTFRGINKISPDDGHIQSFSTGNGSARQEFRKGLSLSDNGTIYFGDSKGITSFTPPVTTSNAHRNIFLTELYIGNEPHIPNRFIKKPYRLELSYKQNTITLGFSTMAVRDAENIRFRFRLKGLDDEWYTTSYGLNRITYSHIPSGKYTLEICAEENSGVSPVHRWKIEVGRPWYRSLTAYVIYLLLLAVLVSFAYKSFRRKQQEEANEKKLRYYANIAHEIRSPMVMIMNPIEKLLKRENDPETVHSLNTMKRNSMRVIRVMDHFLDMRKLDKGQMTLQIKETDLTESIMETLETFAYEAGKRKMRIDFEHPQEHLLFKVDPDNIDTIVFNLVANAMKYTPDGGEIKVSLRIREDSGKIEISVRDTGPGIDEKDIDKIFNRFYQTSNKQYTGNRGFGVGLNLCLMLAELHHGTIKASNRTDTSGCIFTVTIPSEVSSLTEAGSSGKAFGSRNTSISDTGDSSRRDKKQRVKSSDKILLIEDDDEIRLYLEDTLSSSYKVTGERDSNAGLQKALAEMPDLIISDIVMPGMNGLQIVKRIKNNPNTTHIPIILISSKSDMNAKIEGLEYGADAYLPKPFSIEELESTIENILKNRQRIKGKYSGAFQEDKIKTTEIVGNSDKLMERVMNVINDNLDNPDLKVEMLAEEVGLSRTQLHRRMKELTGISTGEFIRNIRLKKAAGLLSEKKINISQVAYMVGFSSQTHFSTAFRKFYGISPTEYINRETSEIE